MEVVVVEFFNGLLTANDKLFSNWTLVEIQTSGGGNVNPANIDVTPLVDDPLNPGVKFTTFVSDPVPNLGTPFGHIGPASATFRFSFSVSTLDGRALIKDNSLALTGFVFDSTSAASIRISETIADASGNPLGDKSVFAEPSDFPNSGDPDHFDSAEFAPQSIVFVEKFIDIQGPNTNDGAQLTMFEQRFSQIPEPSTAALLIAGLALLGALVKRS